VTNIVVACVTALMAIAALMSVREAVKDRRLRTIEKRLEEFYLLLIKYFSQGDLHKNIKVHRAVEEVIVSKRYLEGPKVAKLSVANNIGHLSEA